jgi:leader peptidase (prepilin peptidase) / N-methyltransferase
LAVSVREVANQIKRALLRVPHFGWEGGAWSAAALGAITVSIIVAPGWPGVLGGALAIVMIAIAAIDARRFVIPDILVVSGLALGFVAASMVQAGQWASELADAALRGAVLALLLFGFREAYRRIRGRDGLGLGDVKLAAVAGVWLGWTEVAIAIDLAALSALAVVLLLATRGQQITGTTRVPFGLFFAPAIWFAWLFQVLI